MRRYGRRWHGRHGRHDVISPARLLRSAIAALRFGSGPSRTVCALRPPHRNAPCSRTARDGQTVQLFGRSLKSPDLSGLFYWMSSRFVGPPRRRGPCDSGVGFRLGTIAHGKCAHASSPKRALLSRCSRRPDGFNCLVEAPKAPIYRGFFIARHSDSSDRRAGGDLAIAALRFGSGRSQFGRLNFFTGSGLRTCLV